MPRYRVRNRITGEVWQAEAPFAQDACERLGWMIGHCHAELTREGPYTDLAQEPILERARCGADGDREGNDD